MFHKLSDSNLHRIIRLFSGISIAIVLLICAFLTKESWPSLSEDPLKFISDPSWDPSTKSYNLIPMIIGSIIITLGAIALSVPLGMLTAVFYEYLAPRWLGRIVRTIVELLAGIPSVIYGFWGLVTIVPLLYHISPPGANALAGSIVLGIMVFPTISLFIANGIKAVPRNWVAGGEALGLSRWTILKSIILPGCKGSLFSSIILSLGRALGETMAVLMVSGNIVKIPSSFFDPVRTLTSNIALEMAYALDYHRSALFMSGLTLLIVVGIITAVSELPQFRDSHDL